MAKPKERKRRAITKSPQDSSCDEDSNDESDVREVEQILKHEFRPNHISLLVRWKGCSEEEDVWERSQDLYPRAATIIDSYYESLPQNEKNNVYAFLGKNEKRKKTKKRKRARRVETPEPTESDNSDDSDAQNTHENDEEIDENHRQLIIERFARIAQRVNSFDCSDKENAHVQSDPSENDEEIEEEIDEDHRQLIIQRFMRFSRVPERLQSSDSSSNEDSDAQSIASASEADLEDFHRDLMLENFMKRFSKSENGQESDSSDEEDSDDESTESDSDGDSESQVVSISDHRIHANYLAVKVRWRGCSEADDSWERSCDLDLGATHPMEKYYLSLSEEEKSRVYSFMKELTSRIIARRMENLRKTLSRKDSDEISTDSEDNKDGATTDKEDDDNEAAEIYELDHIVDHYIYPDHISLRVRWKGFTEDDDTWENSSDLSSGAKETVDKYFASLPRKAKIEVDAFMNGIRKKEKSESRAESENDGDDDIKIYEVDRIVDHWICEDHIDLKVHWLGYSEADDTWEKDIGIMQGASDAILRYYLSLPMKKMQKVFDFMDDKANELEEEETAQEHYKPLIRRIKVELEE